MPNKAHALIGMRCAGKTTFIWRTGRANLGHALETRVLLELERQGAEVQYVRTAAGHEVDFHVRIPGGSILLLQDIAGASAPDTLQREVRGLLETAAEIPEATLLWYFVTAISSSGLEGHPSTYDGGFVISDVMTRW